MQEDNKYFCPFCVSSWDCDGPHISPEDLKNFYERIWHIKEDLALLSIEIVRQFAAEHKIDIKNLENQIYKKIMYRSIN